MRVAYVGANGQINNRALLVPKERLEANINLDNDEDRKVQRKSYNIFINLLPHSLLLMSLSKDLTGDMIMKFSSSKKHLEI